MNELIINFSSILFFPFFCSETTADVCVICKTEDGSKTSKLTAKGCQGLSTSSTLRGIQTRTKLKRFHFVYYMQITYMLKSLFYFIIKVCTL